MAAKHRIKPKRNKAYKPKKEQVSKDQLNRIYKSKGIQGLYDHFSDYSRLEKHHLKMTWDLFDVHRVTEMYCLMNDLPLEGEEPFPLSVLQRIYHGDLIIALREQLIDPVQGFKVKVVAECQHIENPEIIKTHVYEHDFSDQPISYNTFMRGKASGKYLFKRDGVFSVQWEGITPEWQRFLNSQDDHEMYELVAASASLECTTQFLSWKEEKDFKKLKLLGMMRI